MEKTISAKKRLNYNHKFTEKNVQKNRRDPHHGAGHGHMLFLIELIKHFKEIYNTVSVRKVDIKNKDKWIKAMVDIKVPEVYHQELHRMRLDTGRLQLFEDYVKLYSERSSVRLTPHILTMQNFIHQRGAKVLPIYEFTSKIEDDSINVFRDVEDNDLVSVEDLISAQKNFQDKPVNFVIEKGTKKFIWPEEYADEYELNINFDKSLNEDLKEKNGAIQIQEELKNGVLKFEKLHYGSSLSPKSDSTNSAHSKGIKDGNEWILGDEGEHVKEKEEKEREGKENKYDWAAREAELAPAWEKIKPTWVFKKSESAKVISTPNDNINSSRKGVETIPMYFTFATGGRYLGFHITTMVLYKNKIYSFGFGYGDQAPTEFIDRILGKYNKKYHISYPGSIYSPDQCYSFNLDNEIVDYGIFRKVHMDRLETRLKEVRELRLGFSNKEYEYERNPDFQSHYMQPTWGNLNNGRYSIVGIGGQNCATFMGSIMGIDCPTPGTCRSSKDTSLVTLTKIFSSINNRITNKYDYVIELLEKRGNFKEAFNITYEALRDSRVDIPLLGKRQRKWNPGELPQAAKNKLDAKTEINRRIRMDLVKRENSEPNLQHTGLEQRVLQTAPDELIKSRSSSKSQKRKRIKVAVGSRRTAWQGGQRNVKNRRNRSFH